MKGQTSEGLIYLVIVKNIECWLMVLTMSLMFTTYILQLMKVFTDNCMNKTNEIHVVVDCGVENESEDDDDKAVNDEAEVEYSKDESNEGWLIENRL